MNSIYGRLLQDRWTAPASDIAEDIANQTYEQIAKRLDADGWIIGRATMAKRAKFRRRPFEKPTPSEDSGAVLHNERPGPAGAG